MRRSTPDQTSNSPTAALDAQPKIYRGKHTKTCKCVTCLGKRIEEYEARLTLMGGVAPEPGQVVPVRPHWRKQKNYLNKDPEFKDIVMRLIRERFRRNVQ